MLISTPGGRSQILAHVSDEPAGSLHIRVCMYSIEHQGKYLHHVLRLRPISEPAHPMSDSPTLSDTMGLHLLSEGLLHSVQKCIPFRGTLDPHEMGTSS